MVGGHEIDRCQKSVDGRDAWKVFQIYLSAVRQVCLVTQAKSSPVLVTGARLRNQDVRTGRTISDEGSVLVYDIAEVLKSA